jgi:hypothetical protein
MKRWQKNYEEIVCMATKLFSFSLCNGNGTCSLLQRVMSDEDKQEPMTTNCFTKCGDMTMGPSM